MQWVEAELRVAVSTRVYRKQKLETATLPVMQLTSPDSQPKEKKKTKKT